MVYTCHDGCMLSLSECMLHFDYVSIPYWHFNPYILQHFSENVFTLVSLVFTVCSNMYKPTDFHAEFYLSCILISRIADQVVRTTPQIYVRYSTWVGGGGPFGGVVLTTWPTTVSRSKKRTQKTTQCLKQWQCDEY